MYLSAPVTLGVLCRRDYSTRIPESAVGVEWCTDGVYSTEHWTPTRVPRLLLLSLPLLIPPPFQTLLTPACMTRAAYLDSLMLTARCNRYPFVLPLHSASANTASLPHPAPDASPHCLHPLRVRLGLIYRPSHSHSLPSPRLARRSASSG